MVVDRLAWKKMYPPAAPDVPLRRIATAVIHQTVLDLQNVSAPARVRARAAAFIRSQSFTTWCGLTSLNPEAVRSNLLVLTLADADDPQTPAE